MADQAVTVRDGMIFWRGCYCPEDRAERLAQQFEAVTDWFRPTAQEYARQLRRALDQVQPHRRAA